MISIHADVDVSAVAVVMHVDIPSVPGVSIIAGVPSVVVVHAVGVPLFWHSCCCWLYQIRRPLGLAFVISFCWLGELLPFYI